LGIDNRLARIDGSVDVFIVELEEIREKLRCLLRLLVDEIREKLISRMDCLTARTMLVVLGDDRVEESLIESFPVEELVDRCRSS